MNFFHRKTDQSTSTTAVEKATYLVVGLGNPGREYRETRHNIGFMVIDRFGEITEIKLTKVQGKAIIGVGRYKENKIILAKPQTYMNLSGQAVTTLMHFYKVDQDHLIVAHDDVDLPFGQIRMRPGGGSAGQKGVGSIIERLGTQDFARLRMGVGRPPGQMDAASFVLQRFGSADIEFLPEFINRGAEAVQSFIMDGLDNAMNRYNPKQQG